ncbi:MAG TPA: tetratricopeptide repeat protein [Blastocatellia bacterium]|nr:tetratricopeptide repeat protein [Blastocatellia bacterium]
MTPITHEEEGAYRFDAFHLDPTRRLLLKEGQVVQLTPKAFDTLLALVRNCGRVMEKDELMQAVWPDTIVEETNLAHNVSALRKLLGQKGADNRFIVTLPGRGYSFVGEVYKESPVSTKLVASVEEQNDRPGLALEHVQQAAPEVSVLAPIDLPVAPIVKAPVRLRFYAVLAAATLIAVVGAAYLFWALRAAPATPIQSVAVLPFKPLVANQRDEVLEMGIADTLITRLSSLKQITVLPISAVRGYTALDQDPVGAGRELAVQALLEGSIQRAGDKIRITARLVNIADGKPLWTRQFDERWTDIFAVQDAISRRVAGDLMVTLTGEERTELSRNYTTDPDAYQLYLIGRYHWNKRSAEGMRKSVEFFRQAIEKDRNYALAYVGLADAYATLGSYHISPPGEVLPLAREAAERALNIDPNLAEAHASLGKVFTEYYWDFQRAEKEFQRAIELKPKYANAHHWYTNLLVASGARFDEAVSEATRALELDQHSAVIGTQLGSVLYRARRYDEGIAALQKTLETEPNHVTAHYFLGLCYLKLERRDEALAEFQKGRATAPNSSDLVAVLGFTYAQAGNRDEARRYQRVLNELAARSYVSPYSYVVIHAGLGEIDEVFEGLEKALEARDSFLNSLKVDPLFDRVRIDPRFTALLRRVGLDH